VTGDDAKLEKLKTFFMNRKHRRSPHIADAVLTEAGLPSDYKTTVPYIRASDTTDGKNPEPVKNSNHHQLCVKSLTLAEALLKDGLDSVWIYDQPIERQRWKRN
jgi:hypothetical protein